MKRTHTKNPAVENARAEYAPAKNARANHAATNNSKHKYSSGKPPAGRTLLIALTVLVLAAGCFAGCGKTEVGPGPGGATDGPIAVTTDENGQIVVTPQPWQGGATTEEEIEIMKERLSVQAVTELTAQTLVYNALDLGVPGDGREDASGAITQAIDEVLTRGGGILYFPSGRYRLTEAVTVDNSKTGWLCLCGDPDGSTVFMVPNKFSGTTGAAVSVRRGDTHFSFISFEDNCRSVVTLSLEADGCSLYEVRLNKSQARCELPCLEVSGSSNTVRQCWFSHTNTGTYQVEFTKYPGRTARGNVLCDVHFGGSYTKCTLVSSQDPAGCQEALTIARNLYLIPAEPMIEVRAVNGLLIANNMLDAASTAVELRPMLGGAGSAGGNSAGGASAAGGDPANNGTAAGGDSSAGDPADSASDGTGAGFGVYNVEIRDNYMGGSKGGVRMVKTEGFGGNISVHDNYIWAPDSMTAAGNNYSRLSLKYNYCVLTGGQAVNLWRAARAEIGGNLVANISGTSPELDILYMDKASVVDTAGFGSKTLPSGAELTEADYTAGMPAVPEVPALTAHEFAARPERTGDTAAGTLMTKYYNVKDYGAAGDGVTDDTNAVKKCLKAAKAASGTAYFPAGEYLITETLKITKDDSKILTLRGDGADLTRITGSEALEGHLFDIGMKYNFNAVGIAFRHLGQGSCVDALYIKAFDCTFTSAPGNTAPLLHFHGSNCWAVRCRFDTANAESYGLCYTRLKGEISINDFITDNTFTGPGKGVLVGNGTTVGDGRAEGLKIHGNTFENTGATQVEIYEILHVNIAYNTFSGANNAIFLSNLGYGPDGIYIDHNIVRSRSDGITSGTVSGGGDYISMVVIHDNTLEPASGAKVSEPVPFNKKMVRE